MAAVRSVALLGLLAVSLSLASATAADEPADGLVFDAIKAPVTVSYTGTVDVLRSGRGGTVSSSYRIEHEAPNLTKHLYTAPASLAGDEIVTKGEDSFSVDVHRHRIVHSKNDAGEDQLAIDDNYILLRRNYRAEKQALESFDGRSVREIDFVNNFTHRTALTVLVDRATKLVLEKREFGPDGSVTSELRFETVAYHTTIPSADFDLPAGYTRVEGPNFGAPTNDVASLARRAGFDARWAPTLPEGFDLVDGRLVAIKGVRTLHVMYSDGIRTVSLFENAGDGAADLTKLRPQTTSVSGRPAQYAQQGRTTILTWSDAGVGYALVGDLTLDELTSIASSITH